MSELVRCSPKAKKLIITVSIDTGKSASQIIDEYLNIRFIPKVKRSKK